jgi:hypothetical protein
LLKKNKYKIKNGLGRNDIPQVEGIITKIQESRKPKKTKSTFKINESLTGNAKKCLC